MIEESKEEKEAYENLCDQLQMYTEMCQDVFANVLSQDTQMGRQVDIARQFDVINGHAKIKARSNNPLENPGRHLQFIRQNVRSRLNLDSNSSRKLKGNFKLTRSAIDLIRNIETYQSSQVEASLGNDKETDKMSVDDGYKMNRMMLESVPGGNYQAQPKFNRGQTPDYNSRRLPT